MIMADIWQYDNRITPATISANGYQNLDSY